MLATAGGKMCIRDREYIDMDGFSPNNSMHMKAYKDLANLKFELGNYDEANGLYNFYLNNVCKNYRLSFSESDKDKYINEIQRLFHRLAEVARKLSLIHI